MGRSKRTLSVSSPSTAFAPGTDVSFGSPASFSSHAVSRPPPVTIPRGYFLDGLSVGHREARHTLGEEERGKRGRPPKPSQRALRDARSRAFSRGEQGRQPALLLSEPADRWKGPAEEGADEKETDHRPKMGSGGHAVETAVPKADSRFIGQGSFWRRYRSCSASQLCVQSMLISGEEEKKKKTKKVYVPVFEPPL